MNGRYDIVYEEDRCYPEHHFCREWECYGTNPDHGFLWEEAKEQIIEFYKRKIVEWEKKTEEEWENEVDYS